MAKTVIEFLISKGQLRTMREGALFQKFGRVPNREPASYAVRGALLKDGALKFEIEFESGDEPQQPSWIEP